MTKFNTDLAFDHLEVLGENAKWLYMSPWDYFYEGVLYGMKLANEKEQENTLEDITLEGSDLVEGTHYFYTTTVGSLTVGNYFPTKEEAEVSRDASEKILSVFKELFECEVSEIIERQGKVKEAYSILPNGKKITLSDAQKFFLV